MCVYSFVQVYFKSFLSIFRIKLLNKELSAVLSDVLEQHVSFLYATKRRYRRSTDLFYVNQTSSGTQSLQKCSQEAAHRRLDSKLLFPLWVTCLVTKELHYLK